MTTDANGGASFTSVLPISAADGHLVTATATDPNGNTSEFSATVTNTFTGAAELAHDWHYVYDGVGRLTYACSDWDGLATCLGDSFDYTYDGAGNLLDFSRWNDQGLVETVHYLYNGANQITCEDADQSGVCDGAEVLWGYDAYGNLLDDGQNTYVYDAANRLVSVTDGAATTTYIYNGDGDRIAQTVDGTTTTYLLDIALPLTMVLSETTGADAVIMLSGPGLMVRHDGANTTYASFDGLGSVRQLTNSMGAIQLAQTYDPYGNPYSYAGPAEPLSPYGFAGEQRDANGLVYLRARYYNPAQGRFFQVDPARSESNLFSYAASNPVMFTDPSGELCLFGRTYLAWPFPEKRCPPRVPRTTSVPLQPTLTPTPTPLQELSEATNTCTPTPNVLGIVGTAAASGPYGGDPHAGVGLLGPEGVEYQGQLAGRAQATATPVPVTAQAQGQQQQQATGTVEPSPTPTSTPYPRAVWFPGEFETGGQLDTHFRHAVDFGIAGPSNRENRKLWAAVILAFIYDYEHVDQYPGTFRGQPRVFYVNEVTGLHVQTDLTAAFVTGYRLPPHQVQAMITPPHTVGGGP